MWKPMRIQYQHGLINCNDTFHISQSHMNNCTDAGWRYKNRLSFHLRTNEHNIQYENVCMYLVPVLEWHLIGYFTFYARSLSLSLLLLTSKLGWLFLLWFMMYQIGPSRLPFTMRVWSVESEMKTIIQNEMKNERER